MLIGHKWHSVHMGSFKITLTVPLKMGKCVCKRIKTSNHSQQYWYCIVYWLYRQKISNKFSRIFNFFLENCGKVTKLIKGFFWFFSYCICVWYSKTFLLVINPYSMAGIIIETKSWLKLSVNLFWNYFIEKFKIIIFKLFLILLRGWQYHYH